MKKHVFYNIGKILLILTELCALGLIILISWHASHDYVTTAFTAIFATSLIVLHDVNSTMCWATKEDYEECD